MAMINCPECQRPVSDQAHDCPSCGYPLKSGAGGPLLGRHGYGYEYKSKATLFGLPLIHICSGPGPDGRLRPAKGFIAIGNVAIGVFALGGISFGLVCLGAVSLGLVCIGGLSIGLAAAFGGFAVGYLAVGGAAIGVYAVGGLCIGVHTLQNDPSMVDFIQRMFRRSTRYWPGA